MNTQFARGTCTELAREGCGSLGDIWRLANRNAPTVASQNRRTNKLDS